MSKEYTAKTIEEAVNLGLKDLDLNIEQVEYVVLEQPTKGFIGIGAKPAKISMKKKKTDAMRACDFLEGLFDYLNVTATTEVVADNEEKTVINVVATDSSSLIGYRGEVLDSLQCLAGAVFNKNNETYKRVVVDCENYREKREQTLKNLALKLAEKAKKSARKVTLEPMNPFERRVIHSALFEVEGVKTVSEGKEPNRYIVIIPDNFDPTKKDFKKGKFDKNNKRFKKDDRKFDKSNEIKSAPKQKGFGNSVFLGNSLKQNQE